jgi:hypothetical protein
LAAKSAAENNIRVLQNALRDVGQKAYVNVEESAILKLVLNHLRKETERHKTILEKLEKYGVHKDRIIISLAQFDPSIFFLVRRESLPSCTMLELNITEHCSIFLIKSRYGIYVHYIQIPPSDLTELKGLGMGE